MEVAEREAESNYETDSSSLSLAYRPMTFRTPLRTSRVNTIG